jgi:sugar O-acyltransferase (sialic acid O-acetyltransferase NeuD family)
MSVDGPLFILGAGGLAREMAQLASVAIESRELSFGGFIVATREPDDAEPVAGTDDWLLQRTERCSAVLGLGFPAVRLRVLERFRDCPAIRWPSICHPTAVLDPDEVSLAPGAVVTAGVVATVNITIGAGALVNYNATLGHDVRIGAGAVINPLASIGGDVTIGSGVLVGTGAHVLQGLEVGEGATVGAGAVVTRSVAPGTTVVGIPARELGR